MNRQFGFVGLIFYGVCACSSLNSNGGPRTDADPSTPDSPAVSDDFPNAFRTFYVSPGGNDVADGLSEGHAWATVARVNAAALQPGDAVLFQRGGEWREALIASASGTDAQPIGFGAYGTGAKPKLWGSDLLDASHFAPADHGVFQMAAPPTINCVVVDHAFLVAAPGAVMTTPGSYEVTGGMLRINPGAFDPRSDGRTYGICVRDDLVSTHAQSHLRIRNLVTDESAKFDAGYGVRVMNSEDVQVTDCEAYRAGKHHFGVINSTGFIGTNLYAAYALPGQGAGGASAFVSFGDGTGPFTGQTAEWHACTFEHAEDLASPGTNYYAFITHGAALASLLVDGMISRGGNLLISNSDNTAETIAVRGGWINDARLEVEGSGTLIDGIRITGPGGSVDLVGSNIVVQNAVITGANPQAAWFQTAVASRGMNNTVRLSTIVMDPAAASYDTCLALVNAGTAFHYYGNILWSPRRVLKQWAGSPDHDDIADAGYNLVSPAATFNDPDMALTAWQHVGLDVTTKAAQPGFMNVTTGDYSLAAGSPALDEAVLPPGVMVPTDFAGRPRPVGAGYDSGAFERQ